MRVTLLRCPRCNSVLILVPGLWQPKLRLLCRCDLGAEYPEAEVQEQLVELARIPTPPAPTYWGTVA